MPSLAVASSVTQPPSGPYAPLLVMPVAWLAVPGGGEIVLHFWPGDGEILLVSMTIRQPADWSFPCRAARLEAENDLLGARGGTMGPLTVSKRAWFGVALLTVLVLVAILQVKSHITATIQPAPVMQE